MPKMITFLLISLPIYLRLGIKKKVWDITFYLYRKLDNLINGKISLCLLKKISHFF
jgi:hypothetical protein